LTALSFSHSATVAKVRFLLDPPKAQVFD